ncbi:MAG: glycosyltransferase family 4 protein [Bdellovibrionia bacterium]
MGKFFRILWVAPEEKGGIRSYTEALWPSMKKAWSGDAMDPVYRLPEIEELERWQPDLIHVQHEFGLFGSKIPGFYQFPAWLKKVRKALPHAKVVATAHSVLGRDYQYPWRGRGVQAPLRLIANYTAVPLMRRTWLEGTWSKLHGVIVHSKSQVETVRQAGCQRVSEIPHFVPERSPIYHHEPATPPEILVFGYLTPEKGSDIAIDAMKHVKVPAKLVMAGGLRRDEDRAYFDLCEQKIRQNQLSDRVKITGFVPSELMDSYFERASLVLVPFRETSGSGSIAQAFSRGAAILASDLPLNREMNLRQPGCVATFKSEDAEDCARQIDRLLNDQEALKALQINSQAYAEKCTIDQTIQKHLQFYRGI